MAAIVRMLRTSIWTDPAFVQLTPEAQGLWLMLITAPDINSGGIIPLRPRRWAYLAGRKPAEEMAAPIEELEGAREIAIDYTTDDVFVRRFFWNERIGSQPRRVTAALDAISACLSIPLRAVASDELQVDVARAAGRTVAPVGIRAVVLRRDGYRCVRCSWTFGDPVPAAPTGRPLFRTLEVDHIYPRSLGGPDDLDNYQTLCTSCNASKGARLA